MADNIVRLQHTPQTPTEVLYQQTVDSLRKDLQATREIARELATSLEEAAKHRIGYDCWTPNQSCQWCIAKELVLAKARAAGLLTS